MNFFASDEMRGRETGTHENDLAALYIKTNIMRLGLKPATEKGDYYQKLPLVSSEIMNKETYLKIYDSDGNPVLTNDSLVYLMPPLRTMDVTGKVVFAGYGIVDNNSGYNDLKDVDIKDKIVLIMTGYNGKTKDNELSSIFDMSVEEPKLRSIFSLGPKAILYVYNPENKFTDAYSSGLAAMAAGSVGTKMISIKSQRDSSSLIQIAFITRHSADVLLKTSGYNLKQMQEKIVNSGKPVSMELPDITSSVRTFVEKTDLASNNVIGIVEGSDPVLKNECVIYTAHFDHIGVNQHGEVFNGADDNASGSMAMLVIAQAFMKLKKKPLRTIVFAWVNGEEKGLLGSQYYVNNPVISMEKTLLDINLDMVGRSKMPADTGKFMGYDLTVTQPGEILLYTGLETPGLLKILASASKEAGINVLNKGRDLQIGSSDFASFLAKGVPAMFFNSGDYPDLHSIRDDVDKIDFDKMEKVSRMVFLLGYRVANQRERIK
jgi:hypothetical protein